MELPSAEWNRLEDWNPAIDISGDKCLCGEEKEYFNEN